MRGVLINRLKVAMFDELIAEGLDHGFGVGWAFRQVAPNWLGPAGVLGSATDDVQVQLRHEIANRAEIDLGKVTLVFQEGRQGPAIGHD